MQKVLVLLQNLWNGRVCVKNSLYLHELIGIYQLDTTQTTKAQLL